MSRGLFRRKGGGRSQKASASHTLRQMLYGGRKMQDARYKIQDTRKGRDQIRFLAESRFKNGLETLDSGGGTPTKTELHIPQLELLAPGRGQADRLVSTVRQTALTVWIWHVVCHSAQPPKKRTSRRPSPAHATPRSLLLKASCIQLNSELGLQVLFNRPPSSFPRCCSELLRR